MDDLKILIAGCGSIGLRHLQNLKSLGVSLSAYDVDLSKLDDVSKRFDIPVFDDLDVALDQDLTAVFVCTPSHLHVPIAIKVAEKGYHIFVEKPISHTLARVDELLKMADERNIILMVGFNLRFELGLQYLKKILNRDDVAFVRAEYGSYLPNWRKGVDYRTVYSSIKSQGGGIILDDVHELDYLCWLFGYPDEIYCNADKLSELEIDVEDTAEIFMKVHGHSVTLHTDYLQKKPTRNCKIVLKNGDVIEWEFGKEVRVITDSGLNSFNYTGDFEINDMYVNEIKHFIDCIANNTTPISDGYNAKKVLEVALLAKKSSDSKTMVELT